MLLKGCVSSSRQHHHPMARKNSEGVPASGCHSFSPPQNPRPGFVGSASPREFGQLLLIKPAFGSGVCLLGMAMPLLSPTARGIVGVSGMPPQSRSWPASAPSWKSTAIFNYGPAARFVNRAPSAFPLLDFKDSLRYNCKSAACLPARSGISRWERLCAATATVPGKVPGAGSSIPHGAAAQISPGGAARLEGSPGGRGEGESRKRGSAEDGNVSEAPVGSILSQRMRGVLCVCGLRGAAPQRGVARKGMSKAADPCIPPGWG